MLWCSELGSERSVPSGKLSPGASLLLAPAHLPSLLLHNSLCTAGSTTVMGLKGPLMVSRGSVQRKREQRFGGAPFTLDSPPRPCLGVILAQQTNWAQRKGSGTVSLHGPTSQTTPGMLYAGQEAHISAPSPEPPFEGFILTPHLVGTSLKIHPAARKLQGIWGGGALCIRGGA